MARFRKRIRASPLDRPPRILIKRHSLTDIMRADVPILVQDRYWGDQVMRLPNPPRPVSSKGEGHLEVGGRLLWWDGDNDVALLQFPVYAGTGHTGIYDGMDDEPFFDASRKDMGEGCVFIPTSAIDWRASGLAEPPPIMVYKSDREWPTAPMICNFAQYRMSARVMGEALGVTRQAIHLAMSKLPYTIYEMTAVLNRQEELVGQCQHPGCKYPARSPRSRLCIAHWEEARADTMRRLNEREGGTRPFRHRNRGKYVRGLPKVEAEGTIDDFLVDQTEARV